MTKPLRLSALAPVLLAAGALSLSACGGDKAPSDGESDPAMAGALGDQIMVDPELAGEEGAAIAANDGQVTLPPADRTPAAIGDAKAKAAKAAGGSLSPAPQPAQGGAAPLAESVATAAQVAEASKAAKADCSAKVQYSNTWAAKLPAEFPVYPRGAVQEAAGTDADGCALRVVNFATPVGPEDVISFYYTMAGKAGYGAEHRLDGSDHVLGGRKDGKAYVVYARTLKGGLTEVDLITAGN